MIKRESIGNMPSNPGVYFFKSASSEILYIGKAKNLKKRVNSYFNKTLNERVARSCNFATRFYLKI